MMNMLIFGPNGRRKGTQGVVVQKRYGVPHIETGVIFRNNIKKETELGNKAKAFIDKGELVPDALTVPMILNRLHETDCKSGWLLDGFPRNLSQAEALGEAIEEAGMKLDFVIEIILDRETAKKRIMGRRLCAEDNNHHQKTPHPPPTRPAKKDEKPVCRVCGCDRLTARADDQDEAAIDKRHGIYYDKQKGTLAAVNYFRARVPVLEVAGSPGVQDVA